MGIGLHIFESVRMLRGESMSIKSKCQLVGIKEKKKVGWKRKGNRMGDILISKLVNRK